MGSFLIPLRLGAVRRIVSTTAQTFGGSAGVAQTAKVSAAGSAWSFLPGRSMAWKGELSEAIYGSSY